MEGLQNFVSSVSKNPKSGSPSFLPDLPYNLRGGDGLAASSSALYSSDSAGVFFNRPPRYLSLIQSTLPPITVFFFQVAGDLYRFGPVRSSVEFALLLGSSSATLSNDVRGAGLPSFSND
ncbi:Thioredoxin superfamily protein, Q [Hibiscus syriacus]|uniref:Thioredoxin superfamily protein, Q n=1 Tax=Hibiscus syriacus TaxID=106335 RepID=A0A6A2XQL6_HIBSY|nr:Thioredoxin superfamily protein, Q [Hibiscus syriacus]